MGSKIIYEMSKNDLTEALQEIITSEIEERVYNRFSNRIVSASVVCEILGITRPTLYEYIKDGRIQPIDSEGKNYKFDLSDILKTDIRKFTRMSKLKFKRI